MMVGGGMGMMATGMMGGMRGNYGSDGSYMVCPYLWHARCEQPDGGQAEVRHAAMRVNIGIVDMKSDTAQGGNMGMGGMGAMGMGGMGAHSMGMANMGNMSPQMAEMGGMVRSVPLVLR